MEADGPLGRGRSSSILKRPHHGHSRKKLLKTLAVRRNAVSTQVIVEKEGVLSVLAKLG
jgi:hypothetical protein